MGDKKIIIANWKMKLSLSQSVDLATELREKLAGFSGVDIVACPNFLSLPDINKILQNSNIKLGAQDVFWENNGAYTGEVSPALLTEAGCSYAIIGHSERREFLSENYDMINKKVRTVLSTNGLTPIVCIGEDYQDRKTDKRDFVLFDQIKHALSGIKLNNGQEIIIAYEPVWAIGSGKSIEPSEAEYAHKIIKLTLSDVFTPDTVKNNFRIIYGGSISSKNIKGFVDIENVDGLLVGGASLNADEFASIIKSFAKN